MSKCNDHWCDHYGKSNEKCDRCVEKESIRDKSDLRVMFKRRQVEQMELEKNNTKKQVNGQTR